MIQSAVALITLRSVDFEKKVLYSLETLNTVIVPCRFDMENNNEALNRISFVVINTRSSNFKHCLACDAKHYMFVREFEPTGYIGTCMCVNCSELLQVLVTVGADREKIKEWLVSKGNVNPHEILRDAIENKIKNGEVKTHIKEINLEKKENDDNS